MVYDDNLTDDQAFAPYSGGGSDTSSTTTAAPPTPPQTPTGITQAPTGPATFDPVSSGVALAGPAPTTTTPITAPPTTSGQQPDQSALDAWFAQHGNGERYSVINGSLIDNALLIYNNIRNSTVGVGGMTQEIKDAYGLNDTTLQSQVSSAQSASDARWTYALSHGGFYAPEVNPNALPLTLGGTATQGGTAPVGTPLDATFGAGDVQATPTGIAGSNSGTNTGYAGGTADTGASSGTNSVAGGGNAINRLLDLAAAMYAGAGVKGGGTGFGGLVGGPLGETNTGELATPAAPASHKGLIIVVVLLAAIGFWWYRKHHKKGA
jgi:hypothetical protein